MSWPFPWQDFQTQINQLARKVRILMTDYTKLQADVDALTTTVASVKTDMEGLTADVAALKAQLAAGNPADQATVDAIDAKVQTINQTLGDAAKANPA